MAAIAIANCTVDESFVQGIKFAKIVTPAASAADTLDVSTIFGSVAFAITSDETSKQVLSNDVANTTITLGGAGSAKVYTILAIGW